MESPKTNFKSAEKKHEGQRVVFFLLPGFEKKFCFGFRSTWLEKSERGFYRLPNQKVTNNNSYAKW